MGSYHSDSDFRSLVELPGSQGSSGSSLSECGKALENAEVQILEPGQWHPPFVTKDEIREANHGPSQTPEYGWPKKLGVARCASTSYKTVDGFDMTFERAEQLYDKLFWASPARTYRHSSTRPKPMEFARDSKVLMTNGEPASGYTFTRLEFWVLAGFSSVRQLNACEHQTVRS